MRGKPEGISKYGDYGRITPAGAGKTCICRHAAAIAKDHPRRCGENSSGKRFSNSITGSPPQVRGKPSVTTAQGLKHGITPAGAGKTAKPSFRHAKNGDHPRRCGENLTAAWAQQRHGGSPPQVRGKPNDETSISAHTGITPAGAGKTTASGARNRSLQDHPRRCGENYQ